MLASHHSLILVHDFAVLRMRLRDLLGSSIPLSVDILVFVHRFLKIIFDAFGVALETCYMEACQVSSISWSGVDGEGKVCGDLSS